MFDKGFVTEIEIDALPEVVWQVLAKVEDYEIWNPIFKKVRGELVEGKRLKVIFQPAGWRAHRFFPKLLAVVPQRELRWTMPFKVPGIYDFEHFWTLRPLEGGRTHLRHGVTLSGILTPLVWPWVRRLEGPFRDMNEAHKSRAERRD